MNLIGPTYNLESRPASVQRTVNLVPVPLEPGNERTGWVFKDVPGLVEAVSEWAINPDYAPDPLYEQVLLLLLGEGSNGSTTFTDSSTYARGVSIGAGGPTISTAQFKLGSASIFGGSGSVSLLFFRGGTEWAQDNWCWDTWIRRNADGSYHGLFYHDANLIIRLRGPGDSGTYQLRLLLNSTALLTSTTSVPLNTWTHLAVSVAKVGSTYTVRMFVNGTLEASTTTTNTNMSLRSAAQNASIGLHDSGGFSGLNDYIDGYRITAATRYTANFTPSPYAENYLP